MKHLKKVMDLFFIHDGEKEVINTKRVLYCVFLLVSVFITLALYFPSSGDTDDTSHLIVSTKKIVFVEDIENDSPTSNKEKAHNEITATNNKMMVNSGDKITIMTVSEYEKRKAKGSRKRKIVRIPRRRIKYRAKQVIIRKDDAGSFDSIPKGVNLIGKLLTGIDTREKNQSVKVLLPYGGKHQNGGNIPRNTTIFGMVSYPGKGEKVYIKFDKGVFPTSEEFSLKALALNSKDYSPGLIGEFHGKTGLRVATTLGLTMIGAMTETLTEKQTLGQDGYNVVPRSTMKNALYKGVSQVSTMESQRQAQKLNEMPEYVTIPAGADLIISLTESFKGR